MAVQNKVREALAQRFTEALELGQLPWQACWAQERQHNAVSGVNYHGINAAWLSYYADSKGWDDPRWCTFNQAREQGWSVRKGEKATYVEYWAYFDTKQDKLLSWDAVHKLLRDDPDYERNLQLRCRTYAVFNGAQIDGIPEYTKSQQTDIGEIRAQRDTLIANMGVGYEEHGIQAFYSPARDTVVLPPEATFDDTYSYMATFLHECGHATGHESRLDRPLDGYGADPESYANEELRAEIASAFTAQALGLQLTPAQQEAEIRRHMAYVQSWATHIKDAPEALFKAIKDAEKISDYLIEKGEFQPIIDRAQEAEKQQEAVQEEPAQLEHAEQIPAVLTPLQKKSLEIANKYESLSMQDKIDMMAQSFGAATGAITTSPCSGKWRGTSDISIQFDNGASLFIGNHATPKAKTKKVQQDFVDAAFAKYNPEIISATKEFAFSILKEREAIDNAIAAEKGLKPYTFLSVEFNDGTDEQIRGYMGWYCVTLEVDGKIRAHMETGLNYDIAGGKVSPTPTRENYHTAGALKENEVDYVFNNVGFSSTSSLYALHLSDAARERAELALAKRLLDDYCRAEFSGEGADFGDPSAIGIGYTTVTDEDIPIQAYADLTHFSIDRYLGEVLVERREYTSLSAFIEHELRGLSFDDLTYASDAELAVFYAHAQEIVTDSKEHVIVAIESTDDYTSVDFHKDLVDLNVRNKDGSYGREVDHYRLVTIGENGRITPLDEAVYASAAEAKAEIAKHPNYELVDYDFLLEAEATIKAGLERNFERYAYEPLDNYEQLQEQQFQIYEEASIEEDLEVAELAQDREFPSPIGRIDYLHTDGRVRESIEYTNPYQLEKDIKEENFYGAPISVVLYKQADGSVVPHKYIAECDPPLNGFSIIDDPHSQISRDTTKEITDKQPPKGKDRLQELIATARKNAPEQTQAPKIRTKSAELEL